jgi:heme-degrading monooxygenase HmoA
VLTRWRDDAAFEAWVNSPAFAHGHRQSGGGEGTDAGHGHGGESRPVGVHSELWSYEVAGGSKLDT